MMYLMFQDHCHCTGKYRCAAQSNCCLRYKTPKGILILLHKGSNYDYYFIIREFSEEFEEQFECLGENTEKYIAFSGPMKK